MPATELPTSLCKARMNEIADLIIDMDELPAMAFRPPNNSASIELAQDIKDKMPMTHQKRCKIHKLDVLCLGQMFVILAMQSKEEERPGHVGDITHSKCRYNREKITYDV